MNNITMLIIAAFKKFGLGLLFILLGITWILINPLIRLGMVGADYFTHHGGSPWSYVSGAQWVISFICLGVGILLFIRKFKPSVKIPEYVYTLAFGAIALLALVDCINLFAELSVIKPKNFERYPDADKTFLVMNVLYNIFNTLALVGVVAVMLFKTKFKKLALIPAVVYVVGVLFMAIANLTYATDRNVARIHQCDYVTEIIFGVLFTLAITFFLLFFVLLQSEQEAPVAQTATEENVEIDLNSMDSVVSETAAAEPQLTQRQKEDLANAKELFDLGAYSEEEYNAEVQRIKLGL